MKIKDRSFYLISVSTALALTAIVYAPMFNGKVPFPADFVFDFPPFAHAAPSGAPAPHTNIGDLVTSFYPYRTLAARAVRQGSLPLWNPYMLSGAPFLAMAQSALFYPPNFLYYVLPVHVAWSIGFVLRRVLAVLFMALFVRKIGGAATGSIVAGLLFGFCGFLTAWQGQAMSDAAIWLPLICYSLVGLQERLSGKSAALAAFAFAMPVLAGHPETAAHLTIAGSAFAAFLLIWKPRRSLFLGFIVCGLLAGGLAAIQIIPTVEWLKYIHHSLKDPWPPRALWTIAAFVSRDITRMKSSIGLLMPEEAGYLAMMTFVAAPLAFLDARRRFAIFFSLCTAAALSAAFAIGPAHWLIQRVTVLNMMKNSRLILVASFGLAALAGLGISAVENFKGSEAGLQRLRAMLFGSVGIFAATILIYISHLFPSEVVEALRVPRFSFLLLLLSSLVLGLKLVGWLRNRPFQVLAVLIVTLDLATVSNGAIPFTKPRDIFPSIELLQRIPKSSMPFRIANIGYAYGANFESVYGYAAVGGYEVSLERIKTFLKDLSIDDMDSVMFTSSAVLETKDRRIDLLNTKYYIVSEWDRRHMEFHNQPDRFRFLYTFGDTDVYENLRAFPAAFLVPASGVEVIADENAQLERLKDPSFDPECRVVLSEAPAEIANQRSATSNASSKVDWLRRGVNEFELSVNTGQPSFLVVSQIDYPGWKAFVDGNTATIVRANYAFPSVPISPGSHHVQFSFEPWTFKLGSMISLFAAAVIVVMLVHGLHRSNQNRI